MIDHSVTKKDDYSFYLVSTTSEQGVPSPCQYTVLYDEVELDPKFLIELSHKLTFLFFTYSGSIRIPAPVKYAERLAKQISLSPNHPIPHMSFDKINGLYFL